MADIQMCDNMDCPSCDKCYRYCAMETTLQAYFPFEPMPGEVACSDFIELRKDKTK